MNLKQEIVKKLDFEGNRSEQVSRLARKLGCSATYVRCVVADAEKRKGVRIKNPSIASAIVAVLSEAKIPLSARELRQRLNLPISCQAVYQAGYWLIKKELVQKCNGKFYLIDRNRPAPSRCEFSSPSGDLEIEEDSVNSIR